MFGYLSRFGACFVIASLVGCGGSGGANEPVNSASPTPQPTEEPINFKQTLFMPPEGKRVNVVGQNNPTIAEYVSAFEVVPGGVTGYLRFSAVDTDPEFDALAGTINWGAGDINIPELAQLYPNSSIHIGVDAGGELAAILRGEHDAKLLSMFNQLSALDRPVFFRWAWEMDGLPWTGYDPEEHKAAWVYMYEILHGLRNVDGEFVDPNARDRIALVFQVAASCYAFDVDYDAEGYADYLENTWWPGAEYVDWFSLSYFTPAVCGTAYVEGAALFASRPSVNRPMMISESTPQGYQMGNDNAFGGPNHSIYHDGGERVAKTGEEIYNEWFVDYRAYIERHNIRYVAYIADDWDKEPLWAPPYNLGYWGDGELWEDAYIEQKWIEDMLENDEVLNGIDNLFCLINYHCPSE